MAVCLTLTVCSFQPNFLHPMNLLSVGHLVFWNAFGFQSFNIINALKSVIPISAT
jgi:hypothetical protein